MAYIEGYYSRYSFIVTSVNGRTSGFPVTEFVSLEEAEEYYSKEDR